MESPLLFPLCIVKAHPGTMKHLSVKLHVRSSERNSEISCVHRSFQGWMHMHCVQAAGTVQHGAKSQPPSSQRCSGHGAVHRSGWREQMCCWLRSYPCSTRQENYWLWFIVGHRKHRHIFPGTKLDSCTCGWEPQASSDLNAGVCFQKKVVFHHKSNFFQLFWLRHCQTLKHYLLPPKTMLLQLIVSSSFSKG